MILLIDWWILFEWSDELLLGTLRRGVRFWIQKIKKKTKIQIGVRIPSQPHNSFPAVRYISHLRSNKLIIPVLYEFSRGVKEETFVLSLSKFYSNYSGKWRLVFRSLVDWERKSLEKKRRIIR